LKPELQGLGGDRIRELKQSGQEVTARVRAPIVAFTGDSLIDVVEREAVVREAKLLIMEVTFVDDRVSVAQCRDKGCDVRQQKIVGPAKHAKFPPRTLQQEADRLGFQRLEAAGFDVNGMATFMERLPAPAAVLRVARSGARSLSRRRR
jgi:predicted Zn-dependent protease